MHLKRLRVKSNRATPNGQNRAQEFKPRRETVRLFRILLIVAAGASAAQFCTGMSARAGEQPPVTSEDDAACRHQGPPGTRAYVDCRRALVEAREQQKAIIQEQKRRDFDRILGEGTGGFDESF
jgi:hypothetical protein